MPSKIKIYKTAAILILCIGLLFCSTSCAVFYSKDNGKHKGWFKNSNNPHHPGSTNPGKVNGRQK